MESEQHESPSALLKTYGTAILSAVVIAILIRLFVVEAYRIPSSSMKPTLEPGDTIFVYKWPFGPRSSRGPKYGEVVVFSLPSDPKRDYIKRVIGLAGDTIQAKKGQIFLNGNALSPPPAKSELCQREELSGRTYGVCWEPPLLEDFGPERIPEGSIFVLGDHRSQAPDTGKRQKTWGVIPSATVKGTAELIWLSIEPRRSGGALAWFPRLRFDRMMKRVD